MYIIFFSQQKIRKIIFPLLGQIPQSFYEINKHLYKYIMHANYMYEGGISYQNQHLFSILTDFSLKFKYYNIRFIFLFEYSYTHRYNP